MNYLNPTFVTERLLIRPRNLNDLEQCLLMDRDSRVTKYISGPWKDRGKHRTFLVKRIEAMYPKGLGYWSAFLKKDTPSSLLGWILLLPYHFYADEVEIGWRFNYEVWGKGYATEAASIVLAHAFMTAKLQKVVSDINPLNVSSINVAEKLGLRYVEDRVINGEKSRSYQLDYSNFMK